jgi:hypothetical protein
MAVFHRHPVFLFNSPLSLLERATTLWEWSEVFRKIQLKILDVRHCQGTQLTPMPDILKLFQLSQVKDHFLSTAGRTFHCTRRADSFIQSKAEVFSPSYFL